VGARGLPGVRGDSPRLVGEGPARSIAGHRAGVWRPRRGHGEPRHHGRLGAPRRPRAPAVEGSRSSRPGDLTIAEARVKRPETFPPDPVPLRGPWPQTARRTPNRTTTTSPLTSSVRLS